MHSRIKSTLAGLVTTGVFALGALAAGQPVRDAAPAGAIEPAEVVLETVELARERIGRADTRGRQGLRLQLAMPYFSFGGRLPRQET